MRRYFEMPAGEPARQELLLEICQSFHPYLMKYLVMICRGHVPIQGQGKDKLRVNKDVEAFLRFFLPKGETWGRRGMTKVARHLHLAFKAMHTDEIYDVLMEQLVRTIGKYDPDYKQKLRVVVETIDHELSKRKQFTAADVNRYLDADCNRHLRLLCRTGFLEAAA